MNTKDDSMMIDKLIHRITETGAPICVGLDTVPEHLPESKAFTLSELADEILSFNEQIIDAVADIVPAVKVQVACYEQLGIDGMRVFNATLESARRHGLMTIADVKRGDIGSTAAMYSRAYLGRTVVAGRELKAFDPDFITVNPYLGSDGILPFVEDCKKYGKGMFVLVKTSNPSSGEFQDLMIGDRTLYDRVALMTEQWGKDLIGEKGFSSVGAVVGATYPSQLQEMREKYPHMFFLIPGYGAQGGTAADVAVGLGKNGVGGIVNSSRGITLAYRKQEYQGLSVREAARTAAKEMAMDIALAVANL